MKKTELIDKKEYIGSIARTMKQCAARQFRWTSIFETITVCLREEYSIDRLHILSQILTGKETSNVSSRPKPPIARLLQPYVCCMADTIRDMKAWSCGDKQPDPTSAPHRRGVVSAAAASLFHDFGIIKGSLSFVSSFDIYPMQHIFVICDLAAVLVAYQYKWQE